MIMFRHIMWDPHGAFEENARLSFRQHYLPLLYCGHHTSCPYRINRYFIVVACGSVVVWFVLWIEVLSMISIYRLSPLYGHYMVQVTNPTR